ncbi:hypothetical protein ACH41H_17535 [Streptomyces sp. NPDC020800]|uniref:hypothetical protein n=1 Tax=Streptomyces sp. NPDC020800 TaxID=3365092 RepID=UPI0037B4C499
MRRIVLRRAAVAASAAALALLATACGGSSGDKGDDGRAAQADKSAPAAPAKALSAADLEKAALTQADVKSGKVVTKVPAQDDIAQDKVTADDPACKPLAYLQVGSYVGKPAATVKRSWAGDAKKPAAGASAEEKMLALTDRSKTVETLASYDDGGAEQAMKDLRAAATKCAGGFSFTVDGEKTKVLKVTTGTAPEGADEAVALTWFVDAEEGVKAPVKGAVVRKGATLAYFPVLNISAAATGKDFDFPTEIVDAQIAKLG